MTMKNGHKLRLVEVKTSRELREVDRIQTALYWTPRIDEVVLSNGNEVLVLSQEEISSTLLRAKSIMHLLKQHVEEAAYSFNPVPEVCRICANATCPFHAGAL